MEESHRTPREVFEQLVHGIANGRRSELHNLYAEDALVEHPYDLPAPSRLEGREALREHFAPAPRSARRSRPATSWSTRPPTPK